MAKKTGAEIVVVPDDKHGQIDLGALERAIDKRTKLVSISHVPTQGGLVQPAEAVGKITNDAGVLYLLDACQSVPHLPSDLAASGVDFAAFSGHKMLGPNGIGVLYGRAELLDALPPARTGGSTITRVTIDSVWRVENWRMCSSAWSRSSTTRTPLPLPSPIALMFGAMSLSTWSSVWFL